MSHLPRVLLCCEHYYPSVGGVQEVMRQIAERLALEGIDVTVVTSSHPNRAQDIVHNGVRVVSFPITGNWVSGMEGPIEEYRRFIRNGRFDALLIKAAQQWTFDAAADIIHEIPGRKLFVPCGFSALHDHRYLNYFQLMPLWLQRFDGLIFYSDNYQDITFARKHGITKLQIIPNGVDEREFADPTDHDIRQRLGIAHEHDLILSVGSKLAAKGHWEIIRAFAKAKLHRPSTLVINANTPHISLAGEAKRLIKHILTGRWPLSWLAFWHGRKPAHKRVLVVDLAREDLVNLYKAADLFVLASHVEYSPLVLFEANAAGTAFLASSAGNSEEIASWTGGGKVMSPEVKTSAEVSVRTLAAELENMMRNTSKLHQMGSKARDTILYDGFTWEKIVEQYRRILLNSG